MEMFKNVYKNYILNRIAHTILLVSKLRELENYP